MNKQFNFAIDCGKSECKYVGKFNGTLHLKKFKNSVIEIDDLGAEIALNSFNVEYEGRNFLIGDMVGDNIDYELSKQNHSHRLSIYLGITRLLEQAEKAKESIAFAQINLAVNIPLNLYKSQQKKTEFAEYLRNSGQLIAMSVNGKPFTFRIQSILLLPEGLGNVYQNMDEYRDKRLLIVDIGSLNVNYLELSNLVPQYDKMAVSTLGINILRGEIAETLSSKYGTMITDEVVEQIFKEKYLYLDGIKQPESKDIVEKLIENHLQMVLNYAKSRKISFSNTSVVFVGGGSVLLQDFISKLPFAIIAPNPQYANVLSFLKVLEAKTVVKA
ncbi:ParM/StbA family protein [Fredinandcohnia quinoae]|uniref:ParM/StbA family protein n=1 Tax=Fredinandcohnia quinoae TaxID=2918902 RepID=A0AAW5E4E9_9BACI|nr:ParM/StbA family protein [Fredinandcohnia sp. SECRCQ15]MCH1627223.1 ParM/StbA family protein [Fredinandcohnia sp. SECRCQ15]